MTGAICISLMQLRSCRIQPLPCFRSACVSCLSHNFHKLRCSHGVCVRGSNNFEPFQQRKVHRPPVLRPKSTESGLRTRDSTKSEASNVRHEFMDGQVQASSNIVSSVSSCFTSTQFCDAKRQILESQDPKQLVSMFVFDIETTGFCRETGRIIEFAIRDLSGGKNNCLHTLINPDRHVPNSHIHGISTAMVNQPGVPRMNDFIPILLRFIRSRQRIPGSPCLFISHNARCFDVPFLMKEFSLCSMDIPYSYWFFDTGPLGREWMKLNGSRQYSLQALSKHFGIDTTNATAHRAMSDVNILTAIFERMTVEMKLTVADILEKSFKVSDVINLVKTKKKG
ncbi:exonuclease DPD1, chloroplastic/mitochondrial-like [Hibiscus syriacus]|nr:exonuclease DPD1, chloroplastic/mitochondrial-like [Hibiscus syriacus]